MCVQSIPMSKKMGDVPRFREHLIPKLLTTEQKIGSRFLTNQWQHYQNSFDEAYGHQTLQSSVMSQQL